MHGVNCHNPQAIKYLSRIRLGLSHLREHKFKHSFQDTLNPVCVPVDQILKRLVITSPPALSLMQNEILLKNIKQIAASILNLNYSQSTHVLLHGDSSLKYETNTEILNSSMNYIF